MAMQKGTSELFRSVLSDMLDKLQFANLRYGVIICNQVPRTAVVVCKKDDAYGLRCSYNSLIHKDDCR